MGAWLLALMLMRQAEEPFICTPTTCTGTIDLPRGGTARTAQWYPQPELSQWVEQHCVAVLPKQEIVNWKCDMNTQGAGQCRPIYDYAPQTPPQALKLRCKP